MVSTVKEMWVIQGDFGLRWFTTPPSEGSEHWLLRSPYQIEFATHIGCSLVFMLCDFAGFKSQAVKGFLRHHK